MPNHRNAPFRPAALVAAVALAAACGPEAIVAPAGSEGALPIRLDLTAFPTVTTIVLEVTAPDIVPALVFNMELENGIARDTVRLPVGSARTITVRGFDAAGVETHRGTATVDVVEGENPNVVIVLRPVTGDQPVEVAVDSIRILLDPPALAVRLDDTARIVPTVESTSGAAVDADLRWATTNPAVALVDADGLVTGVALGQAVIVATWAGVAGAATVTVTDATITVVPMTAPLAVALEIDPVPTDVVTVDYWTGGEPPLRVTVAPGRQPLLTRLLPDAAWEYMVRIGEGPPHPGGFATEPLPPELAAVGFDVTGESTAPLLMLEIRKPTFQGFVAVDGRARVRWFHPTLGSSWGWTRRANGNFVFLDTGNGLNEVTPAGDVVATLANAGGETIHHDVTTTPANTLYFMTRHAQTVGETSWLGERIWEWNPETGDLTVRWNAFDFFAPDTDVGPLSRTSDWLHTNAISVGASGNVIVSSAFLDQVFAVAPDFASIVWRLGGPNATVAPDAGATFSFQHTAAELAEGRVLMFDNRGASEPGAPISRALELAVDFTAGSATTAWEFRPPNGNYAAIISSARRMANGNTMVAFGPGEGVAESLGPIEVYEVAPDGGILWNLVITGPAHMFRATPFDAIADEGLAPSP